MGQPINALALLALAAMPTMAGAATLEINATTSSIQHFFSVGGGYENLLGSYYGGDPVPQVDGRLADFDRLRFTLSAPEGYKFVIEPAPAATYLAMHVGLYYNYAYSGGPFAILPTAVSFEDSDGPLPTPMVDSRAFYGGEQFYLEGWVSWQGLTTFSFTKFIIEVDLSSMPDRSTEFISYVPSWGSAVGILTYTPIDVTEDPGPMVRLAPLSAPEPDALLQQLRAVVTGIGSGKSLANKVTLAQTYFAVPDVQATCAVMTGFVNEVKALAGKKQLTTTQASELRADANIIMQAIGCN